MKVPIKFKNYLRASLLFLLAAAIAVNLTACYSVKAENLMSGVKASSVTGKAPDAAFVAQSADFAVSLFQKTVSKSENSLISPLSVQLALTMTANGAGGQTLTQMQKVLCGKLSLDDMNAYLYSYVKSLPSSKKSKLTVANSLWFRDNLTVNNDFLQKNADYYGASAYRSPFDTQTVRDINSWTKKNTDGTIDSILDKIDPDAVMYLINTVVFDAEWEEIYKTNKLYDGTFTAADNSEQPAKFMRSVETKYLTDGKATGFIKPYKSGYSFAALLPNDGVSVGDYVQSLTGEKWISLFQNAQTRSVTAVVPKFRYSCSVTMNDALKALGMTDAFSIDNADFTKLAQSKERVYIQNTLQKTYIRLDEHGTKAGAAFEVTLGVKNASGGEYAIILDRPFVYAIIDNATNLPVFIGAVMKMNGK